jgi:hypothetical protein
VRPLQLLALTILAVPGLAGPAAAQHVAVLRGLVVSRFTIPGLTVGSVHVLVRAIGFSWEFPWRCRSGARSW